MVQLDSFDGLVTPGLTLRDPTVANVAILGWVRRRWRDETGWGVGTRMKRLRLRGYEWDVFVGFIGDGMVEDEGRFGFIS